MANELSNELKAANEMALTNILKGQPLTVLIDELRKKEFSEPTIDAAITRAYEIIGEQANPDRKIEFGKALLRLDMLFLKNMGITDYKAALNCQMERNKLLRLYGDRKPPKTPKPKPVNTEGEIVDGIIENYENE